MFWMIPMVLVMYTENGNLTAEDWSFIRELWRTYWPFRGDTENHWLMYYASIYLASELFPDAGPDAWYNGKSSVENMAEAKDYIFDWARVTTRYGQGEYDSPNYIGEYLRPLVMLAGFAQDAQLRALAKMMADYVVADFAVENMDGLYGGAHSRLYPRFLLQPNLAAATSTAWLFWGQNTYRRNATNVVIALTGYEPPAMLHRIAHDRRKPYVQRELKRTRWRLRHAGPEAFAVDGRMTSPVYKYSYVHPDFILGCSQGGLLQPIQQQTWSLLWREDDYEGMTPTMFAVQPYSHPIEGTMYFAERWDTVTDLIARSKVDYDSPDKLEGGSPYEQIFQHEATLIGLYDIPEGTRFSHIHTVFSRDLEHRVEDPSGWIFAQGGPIYLAYRPLAEGFWRPVDWTGLLKGGAGGWFSTNFADIADGTKFYMSEALHNGYILQVAPARDFASYEDFQAAIKALPLAFATEPRPTVRFTSLDGAELRATYGEAPRVNGEAWDFADWPLYEGPFTQAARGSEQLHLTHDDEQLLLDFTTLQTTTSPRPLP